MFLMSILHRGANAGKKKGEIGICDLPSCKTEFVLKMAGQRYCSRRCYLRAWPELNRKKHNDRQRQKRASNTDWFRKREPEYYRRHRAKLLKDKPWAYLFKSRKSEARLKGIEFTLTHEWAAERWTGCCELTGLTFEKNELSGPWPMSPSIDRIDQRRGYTPDNSRFILWGINALRGPGNDDTMIKIARALIEKFPAADAPEPMQRSHPLPTE